MIRKTYASTALEDWTPVELLELLKVSRANNYAKDITGMLVYSDRTFFQVLEGEENAVNELFKTIEKDNRYKDVAVIETKKITKREFPYWSIGFENMDNAALSEVEGLGVLAEAGITATSLASNKNMIGPLMRYLRSKLMKPHLLEPMKNYQSNIKIHLYDYCT